MDAKRFEELSRRVGTAATRRTAMRVLAGSVGASILTLLRPNSGAAEKIVLPTNVAIMNCKFTLQKCHDDRQCCSGICKKELTANLPGEPPIELEGVCDCRPSGSTCYKLLEGSFCCSGRCTNEAKCA